MRGEIVEDPGSAANLDDVVDRYVEANPTCRPGDAAPCPEGTALADAMAEAGITAIRVDGTRRTLFLCTLLGYRQIADIMAGEYLPADRN
jgi:hypothetical protein